jgi:hypothetical protein
MSFEACFVHGVLVCTPDDVERFSIIKLTTTLKAIHFTLRAYFPSREDNLNSEVQGNWAVYSIHSRVCKPSVRRDEYVINKEFPFV